MKNFNVFLIFIFFLFSCGKEGPNNWIFCWDSNGNNINSCSSTQQIGSSYEEYGKDISYFSSDDIFIVGETDGAFDNQSFSGGTDLIIVKYNSIGFKQWSQQLGTIENEFVTGSDIDTSGNLYISGFTYGDLDGETNLGNDDGYIVKYNSSGSKQWTSLIGTSQSDRSMGVSVFSSTTDVYLVGFTQGDLTGDSSGDNDYFLANYNLSSGNENWRIQRGSSADDKAISVDVAIDGSVYVTGYTYGDLTGDSSGDSDIFVAKYNTFGTLQWLNQIDTSNDSYATKIKVNGNSEIYITGYTNGSFDGNTSSGGTDIFLIKYNNLGSKQWSTQYGGTGNDRAKGITIDSSNNIYITGNTSKNLSGNSNLGGQDIFISKYDQSGSREWTKQLGSSQNDFSDSVTHDSDGSLYLTGSTNGDFDGHSSYGGTDIIFVKLNNSGTKL